MKKKYLKIFALSCLISGLLWWLHFSGFMIYKYKVSGEGYKPGFLHTSVLVILIPLSLITVFSALWAADFVLDLIGVKNYQRSEIIYTPFVILIPSSIFTGLFYLKDLLVRSWKHR